MGDRCSMQVTCRLADLDAALPGWREKLDYMFLDEPDVAGPGLVEMTFDEVNYANIRDYGDFPDKVPFIATNTSGGDYPEGETVFDGAVESFVGCDDGYYLFDVDDKGNPKPSKTVKKHIALKRRVERYLETGNRDHLKDES